VSVLLVYDITDQTSFKNCKQWFDDVKLYTCEEVVVLLVGNKSDYEANRTVDSETINKFTHTNYMSYMESSAKANTNVNAIFEKLTSLIIDAHNGK